MNALSVRALTKTYKNGVEALKGIDLDVEEGDFFALLGPNGAGKTTLIGIVTSLVNKSGGEASVFGHDIDRELEVAKACIGVVPQEINFNMWETPFTIVVNQAGFYGIARPVAKERAEKYLRQLGLWDKRDKMSRSLSGGMKRRLMIARALMMRPELLIADEATSMLDASLRVNVLNVLKDLRDQLGMTVLFITHDIGQACYLADRVLVMEHGVMVEQGKTDEVIFNPQHEYTKRLLADVPKLHEEIELHDLQEDLQQVAEPA